MKKISFIAGLVMILGACDGMSEIQNSQSEQSEQLSAISTQIEGITNSIETLKTVENELGGYIRTLQEQKVALETADTDLDQAIRNLKSELTGDINSVQTEVMTQLGQYKGTVSSQIASILVSIGELQFADTTLQGRITNLDNYVNGELKDWASLTFATAEQFGAAVETISSIQSDILSINQSISLLESSTQASLASLTSSISTLDGSLQSMISQAVSDCNSIIASAKSELSAAYTTAISEAITASETSMKAWVNEQLAGYYTMAQTDAKIAALIESLGGQVGKKFLYKTEDGQLARLYDSDVILDHYRDEETGYNVIVLNTKVYSVEFIEKSKITEVVIPDGITLIDKSAFAGFVNLESITLPPSLMNIRSSAFSGCTSLTNVYITDFRAWCSMEKEDVQASPLLYANNLYLNGEKLASDIIIPSDVTNIGDYAFYGCTGLTSVTISGGVSSIGVYAFGCCTGLTSVTISEGVSSIGSSAFYGCTGLTSITIPERVTSIGSGAFSGCTGLTSITIPESVTSISNNAFQNCTGLTNMTIPESVTSIGNYAFYGCAGLTNVAIPGSVTSIGNNAFRNCTGITSVALQEGITTLEELCFRDCIGLTNVAIPGSVTSIGSGVFYGCTGLTSVTLPEDITIIGNAVFYNCTGLTSVTIPGSVTSIGSNAFYGCTGLTSLKVESIVPPYVNTTISFSFSLPKTLQHIYVPAGSLDAYKTADHWSSYSSIIVGEGVPEPQPFKIYDTYKENGKVVGVVFWVSADGMSAKIISLKRLMGVAWSSETLVFGTTDVDDGSANTATIRVKAAKNGYTDKLAWISFLDGLGEGWYLPAVNELKMLASAYYGQIFDDITSDVPSSLSEDNRNAIAAFEKILSDNGGDPINAAAASANGDSIFASTENSTGDKAYYVRFGKVLADNGVKTSTARTFRGVKLVTKQI